MNVLINDKKTGNRKKVFAELISEAKKTVHVRLPDGNVIKRKKNRDLK